MTPLESAAIALHWHTDLTVDEATDLLKGTGIAPLEEEDWD